MVEIIKIVDARTGLPDSKEKIKSPFDRLNLRKE
jgi:hypothetical protein